MCGLWGYVGNQPFKRQYLFDAAEKASSRGPYAVGYATVSSAGNIVAENKRGTPTENLALFARISANSHTVVGCCRLSTFGTHLESHNNQPLYNSNYAVVHNGNFYDYKELATKYGIVLETETDTEILLKLLEVVSLETAIKETMALDTPNAVIVIANGQVFAYRQHHPLFIYRNKGIYLCSRKFYKTAELMPEKEIVKLNN